MAHSQNIYNRFLYYQIEQSLLEELVDSGAAWSQSGQKIRHPSPDVTASLNLGISVHLNPRPNVYIVPNMWGKYFEAEKRVLMNR